MEHNTKIKLGAQNKDGELLTEPAQLLDRWFEYIGDLFELIQCLGEYGKQVIVDLVQKIYNDAELPPDFVINILIPLPKSSNAVKCEEHRTISLISHTAKIVLNLIKNIIAPIIEQQLSDSQYGFRTGIGTRDAICQLRIMMERCL